jgi:hypothetical protein
MTMIRSFFYSLAAMTLLVFATPAAAGEVGVQIVFTAGDASIIRAYYRDHNAPKISNAKGKSKGGKKGAKGLPPGIARNLRRGKPLPPGIAKQVLPTGLIALLPPPPHGFERVVLAGKILLVEITTQVIHDVLEDVILGR